MEAIEGANLQNELDLQAHKNHEARAKAREAFQRACENPLATAENGPGLTGDKIAGLVSGSRGAIKTALRAELTAGPKKEKEPNPVDKKRAIQTLLQQLSHFGDYRRELTSAFQLMAGEGEVIFRIQEIFGGTDQTIDVHDELALDSLINATIAFFYGGKKELLDARYGENTYIDPDPPGSE